MGSAKETIRDTFYMQMWDKYELDKDKIRKILEEAEIDINTFQVPKLKLYEETVEKYIKKQRIKNLMKPFDRTPCPYPDCKGEKIAYKRAGKSLWFCSEGGDKHRIIWRTARLKTLMDMKAGLIKKEEIGDKITEFIKEYERYVEGKPTKSSTPTTE